MSTVKNHIMVLQLYQKNLKILTKVSKTQTISQDFYQQIKLNGKLIKLICIYLPNEIHKYR